MSNETSDGQDTADIERLAAGHDAALNDLIERHGEPLFHFLIRLLQNETDAGDLAQETFVRVYQNYRKFDPEQKFSTWLYAIAVNLARDRLRWRLRHPQISLDAQSEETGARIADVLTAEQPLPGETIEASERAAIIRKAVAALPEELRVPLVLAEFEERPQTDIAAILHCSVKAVEMRLYRARQQLRRKLEKLLQEA